MPDYAAYCRHLRERHPDRVLPTEREFFDQFVRARYGDGPTRCC
ncbi:MAG: CstA-like transporter-associated (seleno)protein [Gemmatimonadales bacterium]